MCLSGYPSGFGACDYVHGSSLVGGFRSALALELLGSLIRVSEMG